MFDDLIPERILHDLPLATVASSLLHYQSIGSTNDEMKLHARAGAAEGLLLLAEEQSAGRGRMGHAWAAPRGSSLLLSLLLRPAWLPPDAAFALTMLAGVALCEAIEQVVPVQAVLKWPNDLMLPSMMAAAPVLRKSAGILSEIELAGRQIDWVVIGMGVNVNWAPSGSVDGRDLAQHATSIGAAAGQPVDRLALLRALLLRLDRRYTELHQGHRQQLFEAWRDRLVWMGQPVRLRLPDGQLAGISEGVEPSGALRVRDAQGRLHTAMAGDLAAG